MLSPRQLIDFRGGAAVDPPVLAAAPEAMTRPSIHDIARLAGVSAATVSRVANAHPDVSDETRKRVQHVMHEHGYHVSPRRGSDRRVVSVNVPVVEAQYFASILGGISEALDTAGIELVLQPSQSRESLAERLAFGSADGAILVLPPEPLGTLQELRRTSIPFAVIDPRVILDSGIPCVAATNAAGAHAATEHLLGLGHRRIGLITGPRGWAATEERRAGVLAALSSARRLHEPELETSGKWSIDDGYRAASKLLAVEPRPTAIFAFNDEMAIGALRAALQRGLRVPEEISIVGFDDVDRAELVVPALTTVHQPLAEMGRVAVSLLLRLLEGRRLEALRLELATKLVIRASTAPSASPDLE
jgi:LacI family transcriptional regulator